MRKSIKALLATGLILLPLASCNSTAEAKEEETPYPIIDALSKNHEYTLANYDFLSISTDTYQNNNGRIYKFSIITKTLYFIGSRSYKSSIPITSFYVVENIGKKDYGEYYIWHYSPDVSWSIGNSYNIK